MSAKEYKRRVNAWCMYDWANSAFATTILAAVLPIYYSQVAGANLPSEAKATAYWSLGLSISLLIVAIICIYMKVNPPLNTKRLEKLFSQICIKLSGRLQIMWKMIYKIGPI